jgi:hypothetical protein
LNSAEKIGIAKRLFESARAAGIKVEEIDAHTLLQWFYRCEEFPPEFRCSFVIEAIKFEKPSMFSIDSNVHHTQQYIVRMPAEVKDPTDCMRSTDMPRKVDAKSRGTSHKKPRLQSAR